MALPRPVGAFVSRGKRVADAISRFVAMGLFSVLYVVVFAPVALFMKLRGRKFLPEFTGSESTYFLPKERVEPTLESMRKQG